MSAPSSLATLANLRLAGLLASLASLLPACSEGAAGGQPPAGAPASVQAAPVGPSPTLLELMAEANESVPFQATRRYEARWRVDGAEEVLAYRETITADGAGNFSIEPIEVLEPDMGSGEESVFLVLQKVREGFFFKHRDFEIRDLDLFYQRWRAADRGQTQMLGRACAMLDVERREKPDRIFHLVVDDATGLVLRAEERDPAGQLISLVEYETLDLAPDLTGHGFHLPITNETVVESLGALPAALNFSPVQPKLLPAGFELLEIAVVDEATTGETWARFTYGDGVEQVFFLHEGTGDLPLGGSGTTSSGGAGAAAGPQTAPGAVGGGGAPPVLPEYAVQYASIGPWTAVFGEIDGERFVAMGKLELASLQLLVESAFF